MKIYRSHLAVDDLTLLSALLFVPTHFGNAKQVYHAARTASLCQIQTHGSLTAFQWAAELARILDYMAKAEPNSILEQRKLAVQIEMCGSKQDFKGEGGVVINFAQCMCGGYPTAPVPPPSQTHLRQLV